MKIYSIATKDIIRDRLRSKLVTLRPPYILERVVESLPNLLGAIHLDAFELTKTTGFSWLKPLQETVYDISSKELEMKYIARRFLELKNENRLREGKGQPKEKFNYSAIKTVLDETVFNGLTPFTIQVRNELERILGYGKKTYVFI